METDLPSESSTSAEDATVDILSKRSLVLDAPECPIGRLRRRGSTASDEGVVRSRAAASFDRHVNASAMGDRRLVSSKAMFQRRECQRKNYLVKRICLSVLINCRSTVRSCLHTLLCLYDTHI